MDKISVIVPAYNVENYIVKCLDSLVNQTYQNIEIIIVDDGSTDDTLKIIKDYKKSTKADIKIISQKNAGQGTARNVGIKKASGEYITFVDSDDYIKENMIEALYQNLKVENSDISVCNLIKKYDDHEVVYNNLTKYCEDNVINYILSHPGPVGRLYKRDLFVKNDLYFLEKMIYEDLGVVPLLGTKANKVSYLDEAMYYYIIRSGSTMNQKGFSEKMYDIFKVLEHLRDKFPTKYKAELEFLHIEHLLRSASLRFALYSNANDNINTICSIMKEIYPLWRKNKYYKKTSLKFKLICNCAFYKNVLLLKKINKLIK